MPVTFRELATVPLTQYSASSIQNGTTNVTHTNDTQRTTSTSSGSTHSYNGLGTGETHVRNLESVEQYQYNTFPFGTYFNLGISKVGTTVQSSNYTRSTYMDSVPLQTIEVHNGTTSYTYTNLGTSTTSTKPPGGEYESYTTSTTNSGSFSTVLDTTNTFGTNYFNRGTYNAISVYDTVLTFEVDETLTTATYYTAKTTKSNTFTTATDATSTGSSTYVRSTTIPYTSTSLATTKTESKTYKTTSASEGYLTDGMTTHSVSIPQYSENMYTQKSTLSSGDTMFFSEAFDETSSYARPRGSSSYAIPTTNSTGVTWTLLSAVPLTVESTVHQIVPGGNTTMTSQYTSGNQVPTTTYTTDYESISAIPTTVTTGYSLETLTATSSASSGATYSTHYSTTVFDKTVPYIATYKDPVQLNNTTVLTSNLTKNTTYTTTEFMGAQIVNSSTSTISNPFTNWTVTSNHTQQTGSTAVFLAARSYPIVGSYSNRLQAYGGDYEQLIAVPSSNMTVYGMGLVGDDLLNVSFSSVYGNRVMAPFILTDQAYSTDQNSVSFTYTTDTGPGTATSTTNSLSLVFSTITDAKTSYKDIVSVINGELSTIGHGFTTDATLYVNGFYKINGIKTFTQFTTTIAPVTGHWFDALKGYTVSNYNSYVAPVFITYTS